MRIATLGGVGVIVKSAAACGTLTHHLARGLVFVQPHESGMAELAVS
jgi:hypothetical protein